MCAAFASLYDVAQVLAEHIKDETGVVDVQPGPPRKAEANTEPGVRITLLYATRQPQHVNDLPEIRPDGTRRPPPLSLSCAYLVTASGADDGDPVAAHHVLGRVMTLYHDVPMLKLPLTTGSGAFTQLGDGPLAVVQRAVTLEQVEKVWSSQELALQPWALFDVAPVQLVSQLGDEEPALVVRPGGLALEIRAGTRPVLVRLVPDIVRQGGRVRIEADPAVRPDRLTIGGVAAELPESGVTAARPEGGVTAEPSENLPFLLDLDAGGLETLGPGTYPLTLTGRGMASRPGSLRIASPEAPSVDAPAGPHDSSTDVVLTGANLDGAEEAVFWPDGGVAAPSEVRTVPVTAVAAGTVTVRAAGLPERSGPWRLALRVGIQTYTPYVVLDLVA
ncbi:Pvc16 family protein [Cryptosporangium aurantiacum]|uniref:Pvc16 family protein n=1 Tax=Cryptosporangium aurantiacum TaxID=134849 RepID=UPI0015B8447E|nr:Pvc16 family protein [Cryptosporangium aurantiacum]